MKWRNRLLALLPALASAIAQAQAPQLSAAWEPAEKPEALRVIWQADQPVCVWLIGGGRPDQVLDVACALAGDITIPTGGISDAYAPQLRTAVQLRGPAGVVAEV